MNSPYKFTDPLGLLSQYTTGANGRNWDSYGIGSAGGAFSSALSGFHQNNEPYEGDEAVEAQNPLPLTHELIHNPQQATAQNSFPPPPPNCENQLTKLFGEPNGKPGARMSITTDISTGGYRGYDPRVSDSASPDAQHLFFFPHLTSPDGTAKTPVFVPRDFKYIGSMTIVEANGPMRMFYSKNRDATVFILHLASFQLTKRGDRTFVGYTGGKGGDTPSNNLHAHFAVHRGRGFNPAKRVPFSTVFCK